MIQKIQKQNLGSVPASSKLKEKRDIEALELVTHSICKFQVRHKYFSKLYFHTKKKKCTNILHWILPIGSNEFWNFEYWNLDCGLRIGSEWVESNWVGLSRCLGGQKLILVSGNKLILRKKCQMLWFEVIIKLIKFEFRFRF